jgi:NADPH2:quinone reductase
MRCIHWGGRLLSIGFTSGRWPQAPVNLILIKQISVIGVRAGEYGRQDLAKGIENRQRLYAMAEAGEIDPYISHALPLVEAVDAMRLLEQREVVGKAVVTMNGYQM